MRKEVYLEPEMEVIVFEAEDVIIASGGDGNGNGIDLEPDFWS